MKDKNKIMKQYFGTINERDALKHHDLKKKIKDLGPYYASWNLLMIYILWYKFSFGAKFLKLVQFSFSFVMYSLP